MASKISIIIQNYLDEDLGETGICSFVQLHDYIPEHRTWLKEKENAFRSWDEFSGDKLYPVPSHDRLFDAEHAYDTLEGFNSFLSGEYGEARKRLAKHLIKYFDKLEEENNNAHSS